MAVDRAQGGHGIALRPEHYASVLERMPEVDWVELISERLLGVRGGIRFEVVERLRRDLPVALHGTTLSIGSVDPLDASGLVRLKALAERLEPLYVSDHLAWSSFRGRSLDLLPLPYTEEALALVVERVLQVQETLGRPLLLENASTYLTFAESTLSEWEFLRALSARTGCGILLDVNNLYVTARNNGFDPLAYLSGLPAASVCEIHLAGHYDAGDILLDTHEGPVPACVWDLYREAVLRLGAVPTILEWDSKVPELEEMIAETRWAAKIEEDALEARRDPNAVPSPGRG